MRVKSRILISVLLIGLMVTAVGCSGKGVIGSVVHLENQKDVIDNTLLVKSLDNLRGFEADRWLKDGRILGVRDQPIGENDKLEAKISIYDPSTESFQDIVSGKEKEWLFSGENSEDEKSIIYTALLEGDFTKNIYDFYILDLETNIKEKIVSNMTSRSSLKGDIIYIAEGMKLYKYIFGKELEEIVLPKELISELEDFTLFEFEDYLEAYYKDEKVEGERRDIIKSGYTYRREHNVIGMLTNLGDNVIMQSNNGKSFIYDVKNKTYSVNEQIRNGSKELRGMKNEKIENEVKSDGRRTLWKLNEEGEREKIIDELFSFSNITLSPDENKVAYYFEDKTGNKRAYIYDLKEDEKIKIYLEANPEVRGRIYWNEKSDRFFIVGRSYLNEKAQENITSLVTIE